MKQLVILACYLNIGNLEKEKFAMQRVLELKAIIDKTFSDNDVCNETDSIVKTIIIPVKGETRMECIYPKLLDEEILEKINTMENRLDDFLKQHEKK